MKSLFNLWPFAAIFILVAIFFYPVWLQGKIPLPGDFIVGVYYPWLDYIWGGYSGGVPVKNPITTDVVSFIYPMQTYAFELMRQGIMPLWNSLILAGTPLAANFQSAPFTPTNFFYLILPQIYAWTAQIIIQPLLAAVFLYLLLRSFGINKLPAVAGGLFYGFSGFNMIWMQWNGHALVAAFFPLVILLVKTWLKTKNAFFGILLSVTLALQILSGYPQIILYEFLAIFLFVIIFDRGIFKDFKSLLTLSLFIILGITTAAVQIIPGLELLNHSQREVEDVINVSAFLPWQYLITFLAPDYFGNHATGNFWGEGDYTLVTGFSGVTVIVLAGLGILKKEKGVIFGGSMILLSLLISLPNPLTIALKESGLLGLQAASAHRALILSNLGFAILASFGLNRLLTTHVSWKNLLRAFYVPAILLFGFLIGTYLALTQIPTLFTTNYQVALKNLILPIGIFGFTFILLMVYKLSKKFSEFFVILVIALAIFELFRFGWKFTPFSDKEFAYPKTSVIDFLQQQEKPFRVVAEDVIPINMMMAYRIETVEGYDAVYPLSYAKFLAKLNSGKDSTPMGRYGSVTNPRSSLIDLANGKYILALKRDKIRSVDENGTVPDEFSRFKKVFEDKTVVVLENPTVLPRAFLTDNLVSITMQKAVKYLKYGNSESLIEVKTEHPTYLFISDTYYPGWKAEMNGQDIEIIKAADTFRAIPIKESGVVRMYYDPESFKLGLIISLISLGFLGMIGITKYVRQT
jgi:hypothetical protein